MLRAAPFDCVWLDLDVWSLLDLLDLLDEAWSSMCLVWHLSVALGCLVDDARVWNKTALATVCSKACPQPIPLLALCLVLRQSCDRRTRALLVLKQVSTSYLG